MMASGTCRATGRTPGATTGSFPYVDQRFEGRAGLFHDSQRRAALSPAQPMVQMSIALVTRHGILPGCQTTTRGDRAATS
jgi:hypothetical protein